MNLKPTMRLDMSPLATQAHRLVAFTKKTGPEIASQRLMNVAGRAANKTRMAEKGQIHRELGVIARAFRVSKAGKTVRGKRIYAAGKKGAPLSALIINKRRGRAGKKGLYGKEMAKTAGRMIGARARSTGFERSGWFPGIRTLAGTLKKPFIIAHMKGISVRGQPKGRAVPAQPNSLTPRALIENSAKGITKVGAQALQDAINEEASEINRHIESMMQPGFNEFNRR